MSNRPEAALKALARILCCFSVLPAYLPAAEIKGRVIDANTGEALARVVIRAAGQETLTAPDGTFALEVPGSTELEIQVSSVSYRPFKTHVDPNQGSTLEIVLVPDTLRRTDRLEVTAGPYAVEEQGTALSLAGSELRNLASVLTDDPLRAVQGLPGVNPNDDFQSQFSIRGAAYHRLGVYIDGILLHGPFHALQADPSSASITIINGDVVESAVLHPGVAPGRFADRTAGMLDLRVREGSRDRFSGRLSASASNATATIEGPLGQKGSWLASARKSYLQYIINTASDDDSLAFGFWDAQGRAAYDVGRDHTLSLSLIEGSSGLDRSGAENVVGLNTVFLSDYQFTLAALHSRWTPGNSLALNHSVAWVRERFRNRNRDREPLAEGHYGEWVANADNAWEWRSGATLLFGGVVRRLRDDGYLQRRVPVPPFILPISDYRGNAWRGGGFFSQRFSFLQGRLQLRAGTRWDGDNVNGQSAVSPSAGITFFTGPRTQFHLDWGMAAQFPEISQYFSNFGSPALLAERSTHVQLAVEHRLDTRTRLRVEGYQRLDRDLLFRPLLEPRIVAGQVFLGRQDAPIENALRGYARGLQVVLQRRTSNGLTGWVGYSYGVSRLHGEFTGPGFDSDFDQRHLAHLYLSYRLRPTVNLGGRWVYGSGFPVRGYFDGSSPSYVLSEQRNLLRIPAYQRTDIRIAKTIVRDGWHLTMFGEVINAFNRDNVRQDDVGSYNPQTGTVRLRFETLLPIVPSAGVAVEF